MSPPNLLYSGILKQWINRTRKTLGVGCLVHFLPEAQEQESLTQSHIGNSRQNPELLFPPST